jgi:hypothetical protein
MKNVARIIEIHGGLKTLRSNLPRLTAAISTVKTAIRHAVKQPLPP